MRRNWLISRRTSLKGIGVALGLPLLETMGWADPPAGSTYKPPVRIGFMYMPDGVHQPDFWPTDPKTFPVVLPKNLEPLRPVIDECLMLDGLHGAPDGKIFAPHALELSSWLTATLMNPLNRANIDIATSADQIAAQHLGVYTVVPSLELGYRDNAATGLGENGVTNRYYSTGNFRTATQPLPVETKPANVYQRLFSSRTSTPRKRGGPAVDPGKFASTAAAAPAEESLDRSMLDLVLGGAKDLRGQVSSNDQRRLDEYLDSMRSLEKRLTAIERQQAEAAKTKAGTGAASAFTRSPPIDVTIPNHAIKWSEHTRLMGDLMILAFQTDLTRVCTLIPSHPNGLNYPELGFAENHHDLSHNDGKEVEKLSKLTKINYFNLQQFAYIVGRMKSLKEGAGTLLDNSIFMWGCGMDHGGHTNQRLPTILAGRGGGTVRPGRYAKCKGNIGDLLTAILARAGVPLDKPIGCGTKLLPDLS